MDNFGSVVDRVHMELGSTFLIFLRIKVQVLERIQCVSDVDGATHAQKAMCRVMEAP